MAPKASGSRKLKKSSLPKFEADVYSKLSSGELIVFAVHYLIEHKVEITLDDIVSVCFLLFPHKFGLKKYPKWPDSAYVSRRWSDIRRKRYIAVNNDPEYKLTVKGLNLVARISKALGITAAKSTAKVQPKQITVKKTKSLVNKKKINNPAKKTIKASLVIQDKKAQPIQKSPAPVKKKQTVHAKEIKQVAIPEAKKMQPVQEKKKPVRAKEIKQVVIPETKKTQPVQEKKTTPSAPVKKIQPIHVKQAKQIAAPEIKKVTSPAPVKKKQPVHAPEVKQIAIPEIKKVQPVQEKKAISPTPVKKKQPVHVKEVKQVAPPEVKKVVPATPIKKKQPVSTKPIKQIEMVEVKPQIVSVPAPIKEKPVRVKPIKQVEAKPQTATVPEEKVVQLELLAEIKPVQEKKIAPKPVKKQAAPKSAEKIQAVQPKRMDAPTKLTKPAPIEAVIVQPVKVEKAEPVIAATPVSREAKERALKFTRMMERSDAYVHYKKNGSKSTINEFDFRSLLLCTMESSAETLARNVDLFKGYAEIHNRQDLMLFLNYCEDKFSYLLKPQKQFAKKLKK